MDNIIIFIKRMKKKDIIKNTSSLINKKYKAIKENKERILYSAVVLDDHSKNNLISYVAEFVDIPLRWKSLGDHMTIIFKDELPPQLKKDLDKEVKLIVKKIGLSDDAIAVEVEGYPTTKDIPHITVAIPPDGTPVNSNYIEDWEEVNDPLILNGKVTEVRY